jgi:hypothetical protein
LVGRHGIGHIRYFMTLFRRQEITALHAATELGISTRRFRQLYQSYLEAVAREQADSWTPGISGGNRQRSIPEAVAKLWRRLLTVQPPSSYSFAASEALRRFEFTVSRATVRRWAGEQNLQICKQRKRDPAPVRRWQCSQIGALWQLDVSPHAWFGRTQENLPLFDMLDDCSRLITGARLYDRENLAAYVDFLPRAFERYGLPLALYVDYHSFFFTHLPDSLTYLGDALRFYDISFKYAPTPQAKGKIERLHLFWQNRLPTFFAAEAIRKIAEANLHLDPLREHHNRQERHRELQRTPQAAWDQARRDKRSVLRPCPRCPWWNYIWSLRTPIKVDENRTVPVGSHRYRVESCSPKTPLLRCQHRDGSYSFLLKPPQKDNRPMVVLRIEAKNL